MNIAVTGGLGYIGSHACVEPGRDGHRLLITDNRANSKPSCRPGDIAAYPD